MPITYKKAAQADIDTVTDLLCMLYDIPRDELIAENMLHFANADMAFFLAYEGTTPVGVSHGSLRREYVNGANDGLKGYLEAVYVLPGYRLNGIASELVKRTEQWAGLQGCREFASDCLLDNAGSRSFHLKVGFVETEHCIFFLKPIEQRKYEIREVDADLRAKLQPILDETWGSPYLAVNGRLWDSRVMPGFAAVCKSEVGEESEGDAESDACNAAQKAGSKVNVINKADEGDEVLGYLLYEFHDGECEIMVLESAARKIGVASALIERLRQKARSSGVSKVIVQTSNDNVNAFRFYQRRGFTIRAIRTGALDAARKLKPVIPLIGEDGIPLRDEIEFELEV